MLDWIYEVEKQLKSDLPGHKLDRMVKGRSLSPEEAISKGLSPKESAVLLLLYPENNEWYTIFTLRHNYKGVHSNQVSLPGGKREISDKTIQETALRETQEEIGVIKDDIRILGKLSDLYIPPSNFIVEPFVGFVENQPIFKPEVKEVKELITSPIQRIFEEDVIRDTEIYLERYNGKIKVKYFDIKEHIVWGATAMILKEFRDLMT